MESRQNDSLTADSVAFLEAQGIPTDDEDEEDIHYCKKCRQAFTKLEAYLEHKVKHDKFKMSYNRAPGDRRMVLPTLMKKEPPPAEGEGGAPIAKPTRKRRKKKTSHVDIQLIAERNTYICTKCDRKFSREATLKWHVEYDHKTEVDSEEEEEEGEGVAEEEGGDLDASYIMKREPPVKRLKWTNDCERPYCCEDCGLSFKEVAVLKTHMLTHSNFRQFRCTYDNCPYAFKTKGSLVRHTRRHTGERPYACESCHRKFAESGALTRHMRSRNPCSAKTDADLPRYGKKWTYVPNIPAVVSDDKNTDNFISMVPGEMVMVMTEGENGEQILTEAQVVSNNETVSSLGETLMEEGEVTESEVGELVAASSMQSLTPTQCRVCKEECLEVEALRAHLRLHLADFPFHCGLCHFTTEQRDDLRNHMQSKHLQQLKGIDPNVLLPPAGSVFKENSHHLAKDNTEAQSAVKQLLELPTFPTTEAELTETLSARAISRCPVCNRAFRGTSYLKQHMKSHTGDRPHECPVCHKAFVTKDALNKHLIVHTDERNFKCGECGKLFKRIGHVREHLKIHNAERPFPCTACDKSFKTNNALKVHGRTHSDFYPYECRTCRRHFREKGSLQRHLRTHTGERPFRCPRCGRGFAEHGTLNRHLKAKVQCNYHLGYQPVDGEDHSQESETHEEEEHDPGTDMPTVLAEFSSVVADTQQYIVADGLSDGETQTTEYVVLHTDLSSEDIHNVEIVTDGDIDPDTILSTVSGNEHSYVVVNEPGNHLRIIDSSTGLTLATMPADSDQLPSIAMDDESGSITVQTESGPLTITTTEEAHRESVENMVYLSEAQSIAVQAAESVDSAAVHAESVDAMVELQSERIVDASCSESGVVVAGEGMQPETMDVTVSTESDVVTRVDMTVSTESDVVTGADVTVSTDSDVVTGVDMAVSTESDVVTGVDVTVSTETDDVTGVDGQSEAVSSHTEADAVTGEVDIQSETVDVNTETNPDAGVGMQSETISAHTETVVVAREVNMQSETVDVNTETNPDAGVSMQSETISAHTETVVVAREIDMQSEAISAHTETETITVADDMQAEGITLHTETCAVSEEAVETVVIHDTGTNGVSAGEVKSVVIHDAGTNGVSEGEMETGVIHDTGNNAVPEGAVETVVIHDTGTNAVSAGAVGTVVVHTDTSVVSPEAVETVVVHDTGANVAATAVAVHPEATSLAGDEVETVTINTGAGLMTVVEEGMVANRVKGAMAGVDDVVREVEEVVSLSRGSVASGPPAGKQH